MSTFGDTFGKTWVPLGSLLNQTPDGIYLIDEEGAFICEEDNTEILLTEEAEV